MAGDAVVAVAANRNPHSMMPRITFLLLGMIVLTGCSARRYMINRIGDALAGGASVAYAGDDDPELIRDAAPFSLKLIESLLVESPRHAGLLLAACSGFTQYGYAFVQQQADELESTSLEASATQRQRAARLYRRAKNYGLRGLDVRLAGFEQKLRANPKALMAQMTKTDVPLLYWTAVSWGALISLSKDNPETVADVPLMEALIDRAAELDVDYADGAIHSYLIAYEMARPGGGSGALAKAQAHFQRAVALSGGLQAGPFVAYAESVMIGQQNRKEFESLLKQALDINVDAKPEWRLMNAVAQRRAKWLLSRTDELFIE